MSLVVNLFREISGIYYFWNEAVEYKFSNNAQILLIED